MDVRFWTDVITHGWTLFFWTESETFPLCPSLSLTGFAGELLHRMLMETVETFARRRTRRQNAQTENWKKFSFGLLMQVAQ